MDNLFHDDYEVKIDYGYSSIQIPYVGMPQDDDIFDKVVFLDIDGVLNDDHHLPDMPVIDEGMVRILSYIICQTNARIVLSSSWKRAWIRFAENGYESESQRDEDLVLLHRLFRQNDLVIDGFTPESESGPYARPHEIRAWLLNHRNVRSFVILDDDDFWEFGWLNRHFVCTQTETGEVRWSGWAETRRGLTMEHAKRAIEILNDGCPMSRSDERRSWDDKYLARIREQRAAENERKKRREQSEQEGDE